MPPVLLVCLYQCIEAGLSIAEVASWLCEHEFVAVSALPLSSDGERIVPAELALVVFRLDMGVDQYYHYLLRPELPLSKLEPRLREGPLGNSTSLLLLR